MKPETATSHIADLRAEATRLPQSAGSTEFVSWNSRARSTLTRALGEKHHITTGFVDNRWTPAVFGGGDMRAAYQKSFNAGLTRALGLLDAASAEIGFLAEDGPIADATGIDLELWEHVTPEVQSEAWGKVASQAVIFTEDRIRRWTGRPNSEVGKELAVAVFGKAGQYQMGLAEGEKQGWQLLAQGLAQAVRNVDAHRIQQRPDHKRYAMGVLGTCSLVLTQLRYEHGNRFHDTSPASSE